MSDYLESIDDVMLKLNKVLGLSEPPVPENEKQKTAGLLIMEAFDLGRKYERDILELNQSLASGKIK